MSAANRNRISKTSLSGPVLCDYSLELTDLKKVHQIENISFDATTFGKFHLILIAEPCYNYQNLSDADRKSSHVTPIGGQSLCDKLLSEGWYRFVGAAGTKMPTTHVPAYRCGTDWSGWLDSTQPTVEDGEVRKKVCFSDRSKGCMKIEHISVKNCGSYYVYKLHPLDCNFRYCGTD